MKRTLVLSAAISVAMLASACTTTQRVSVVQPGDTAMTCSELRSEFTRIDEVVKDGQSDQGVNTANVAAVLFFWPAAVGNYMSARDAIAIAERRKEHLMEIYNSKNCDAPGNANLVIRVPNHLLTPLPGFAP